LFSLVLNERIYGFMNPQGPGFSAAVFVVGFISTIFFGWLPLYLPELFPTAARATGPGVSFNFGRILTAIGVLGTGSLTAAFGGDYAAAGRVTSLVYALGMVVILFAPDTTGRRLREEYGVPPSASWSRGRSLTCQGIRATDLDRHVRDLPCKAATTSPPET